MIAPLGISAAVFGFSSAALTGICKKLTLKSINIVTLSHLQLPSVKVSTGSFQKALTDQKIEESEFQLVLDEMSRFNVL